MKIPIRTLGQVVAFLMMTSPCLALEKLDERYLVSFGNVAAPIKVTQYYSFACPHCIRLFQEEFQELKTRYLSGEQVALSFHPVPMDVVTVQAMACLVKLNEKEKRAFLEVILEEAEIGQPELSTALMRKAMEVLLKPIPDLGDSEYIQKTTAFQDAFRFISQEEKISAIPTAEVNGTLYAQDIPDLAFLKQVIERTFADKEGT